jgi:hypothetical protein
MSFVFYLAQNKTELFHSDLGLQSLKWMLGFQKQKKKMGK